MGFVFFISFGQFLGATLHGLLIRVEWTEEDDYSLLCY